MFDQLSFFGQVGGKACTGVRGSSSGFLIIPEQLANASEEYF